jgi:hypothetical protein
MCDPPPFKEELEAGEALACDEEDCRQAPNASLSACVSYGLRQALTTALVCTYEDQCGRAHSTHAQTSTEDLYLYLYLYLYLHLYLHTYTVTHSLSHTYTVHIPRRRRLLERTQASEVAELSRLERSSASQFLLLRLLTLLLQKHKY